jgi:nitrogen regulatory protein P-II 1
MTIKKITAIVNEIKLNEIEQALLAHGVKGFTVTQVRGRGSYCNNYCKDTLVSHSQIDVFSTKAHAYKIAKLIMDIADVGAYSEGLVSVMPVDDLYWVYQQTQLNDSNFNFNEKENNHE